MKRSAGVARALACAALAAALGVSLIAQSGRAARQAAPLRMSTVSPEQMRGRFASKRELREAVCKTARSLVGMPYVRGDNGRVGFDCSSLVQESFRRNGVALPRVSVDLWFAGRAADPFHPRPGDLVFYTTAGPGPSHVGIFVGDGRFVHAPAAGKTVRVTAMSAPYWRTRYAGAVDVVGDE